MKEEKETRKQVLKQMLLCVTIMIAVLFIVVCGLNREICHAATSYTNAKEFYNSTNPSNKYHAEVHGGNLYVATRAKKAASSVNLKYTSLGFDITLSAGGKSVDVAVKRVDNAADGSMVNIDRKEDDDYIYQLYKVSSADLYDLMIASDEEKAKVIIAEDTIKVDANAIMTTKKGDTKHGNITENGEGGVTESGTVYHLKDAKDLAALKKIFSGHDFMSYMSIKEDLLNYMLTIYYNIQGTLDTKAAIRIMKEDVQFNQRAVETLENGVNDCSI